ncbi:MAG TPA: thioesterase family protein, partial [Polyangiaceae bacterium]|nr:thioesterase family protein [Polyangiaceae bacterium]
TGRSLWRTALVADLDLDTRVTGELGRYRANVSRDWEIWGPNGGYMAGLALRAASRESPLSRPASFYCQYLNVAEFAEVSLTVTKLRESKRSCALRVSMTQGERPILEALTWLTDEAHAGLEHDETTAPDVSGPDGLPSFEELKPPGYPWYSFWQNLETRLTSGRLLDAPGSAKWSGWVRYRPRATFDDPIVDAIRSLILLDTMFWPAAAAAHARPPAFLAPSLDVAVQFHRAVPESEWLLCDTRSPIAAHGLIGGTAHVWSADRRLVATGTSQLLCRPNAQR